MKSVSQGTANAITHNSSVDKDSITVVWTPPSAMTGEVVFVVSVSSIFSSFFFNCPLAFQATVVGEKTERSTYWENIRSNSVKL